MSAVRSSFFISTICGLMLMLLAAIGGFQAWLHFEHAATAREAEMTQAADLLRLRAERAMQSRLALARALAAYVESQQALEPAALSTFVATLRPPSIDAALLLPDGHVDDALSGSPQQAAMARAMLADRDQQALIARAVASRGMAVSAPLRIAGRSVLAAHVPIFIQRDGIARYWGLASVLIDLNGVLDEIGVDMPGSPMRGAIGDLGRDRGDAGLIAGDPAPADAVTVSRIASFPGGAWEVTVISPPAASLAQALLRGAGPAAIGALLVLALVMTHSRLRGEHRSAIDTARTSADIATSKLDSIQAQLRTALDTISDGFAYYDRDDRLVVCNERYRQMYAASADVIQAGVRFEDVVRYGVANGQYPDAGDDPEGFVAQRLAMHREAGGRSEMRLAGGRWVMVAEHRTSDGGIVGIRTDITELKRRSLDIEGQQILLRTTLESLGDGIAVFDDEGLLVLWNSRFAALADIDPVCMERGIGLRALVAVQGRDGILEDEDVAFADGQGHLEDARLSLGRRQSRTGRAVRVDLCWTGDGQTVVTLVDETEVTRAADILSMSEQRLRGILEISPIGIGLFDREGRTLFYNERFREMLGLSPAEMASYAAGSAFVDPADMQATVLALRDHGVMPPREFRMRRPDGTVRRVTMSARNLIFDGHKATVCHLFDVTDMRPPAAAIQAGAVSAPPALAWDYPALPGEAIAHEIEAPARYVAENLRFLKQCVGDLLDIARAGGRHDVEALADDLPAAIEQGLEGIAHITQIADAIGDLAPPGGGDRPFDLNRAIRAALTFTGHHWRYSALIDLDLDGRLPPLRGDLHDLRGVLMTAIARTAQAIDRQRTPEPGRIAISTRLTRDTVEITITDGGAALPEWNAIMRSAAVLRLGGRIEVDAAVGAMLRISLPVQQVSAQIAA